MFRPPHNYYEFTAMPVLYRVWVGYHDGRLPRYVPRKYGNLAPTPRHRRAFFSRRVMCASPPRALGLGSDGGGGGGGSFLVYCGQILMFGKEHPFEKYNGTSTQNTTTVTYT